MNLSRFVGGDSGDTDPHRGLNLGGAYRLFDVGRLGVWIEGYYRQKGADGLAALAGGAAPTLDVGLDYVEVPVLVRLDLTAPGSRVRPYLHGGPAFGWRIDCSVSLASGAGAGPTPDCDDLLGGDLESTLRDYEQGLVVGGGVDLGILGGAGSLNLDARLTRGLSRLADDESRDVKNQSFTLMLGWVLTPGGLLGTGLR
jgi:hypothetical protein